MVYKFDSGFWLWILTCVGWAAYLGFGNPHVSVAVGLTGLALVSLAVRTLTQEQRLGTLAHRPAPPETPALAGSPYREAARAPRRRGLGGRSQTSQLVAHVHMLPRDLALQLLLDLPRTSRRLSRGTLAHRVSALERLVGRVLLECTLSPGLAQQLLRQLLQNRSMEVQHALLRITTHQSESTTGDKPC